ncbi:conserved hypothetical protein [Theileria orientalis strain Shintoku]|uniref:Uncharacterized protein n=1 Tax=Theileria orientalis strain Shintoku TaxID=869250 RepID=J7M4P6_THEOR|nr:conserved hypothetical protein [Theileria orientalis strain Shintoku]BAM42380.1 conserved hypothetical protein [Theileria orientalis strain Shintoku]|eukprot:XP_009692681.1 conserved hypothetical protein [Theileria orientalis strain Shintoku]
MDNFLYIDPKILRRLETGRILKHDLLALKDQLKRVCKGLNLCNNNINTDESGNLCKTAGTYSENDLKTYVHTLVDSINKSLLKLYSSSQTRLITSLLDQLVKVCQVSGSVELEEAECRSNFVILYLRYELDRFSNAANAGHKSALVALIRDVVNEKAANHYLLLLFHKHLKLLDREDCAQFMDDVVRKLKRSSTSVLHVLAILFRNVDVSALGNLYDLLVLLCSYPFDSLVVEILEMLSVSIHVHGRESTGYRLSDLVGRLLSHVASTSGRDETEKVSAILALIMCSPYHLSTGGLALLSESLRCSRKGVAGTTEEVLNGRQNTHADWKGVVDRHIATIDRNCNNKLFSKVQVNFIKFTTNLYLLSRDDRLLSILVKLFNSIGAVGDSHVNCILQSVIMIYHDPLSTVDGASRSSGGADKLDRAVVAKIYNNVVDKPIYRLTLAQSLYLSLKLGADVKLVGKLDADGLDLYYTLLAFHYYYHLVKSSGGSLGLTRAGSGVDLESFVGSYVNNGSSNQLQLYHSLLQLYSRLTGVSGLLIRNINNMMSTLDVEDIASMFLVVLVKRLHSRRLLYHLYRLFSDRIATDVNLSLLCVFAMTSPSVHRHDYVELKRNFPMVFSTINHSIRNAVVNRAMGTAEGRGSVVKSLVKLTRLLYKHNVDLSFLLTFGQLDCVMPFLLSSLLENCQRYLSVNVNNVSSNSAMTNTMMDNILTTAAGEDEVDALYNVYDDVQMIENESEILKSKNIKRADLDSIKAYRSYLVYKERLEVLNQVVNVYNMLYNVFYRQLKSRNSANNKSASSVNNNRPSIVNNNRPSIVNNNSANSVSNGGGSKDRLTSGIGISSDNFRLLFYVVLKVNAIKVFRHFNRMLMRTMLDVVFNNATSAEMIAYLYAPSYSTSSNGLSRSNGAGERRLGRSGGEDRSDDVEDNKEGKNGIGGEDNKDGKNGEDDSVSGTGELGGVGLLQLLCDNLNCNCLVECFTVINHVVCRLVVTTSEGLGPSLDTNSEEGLEGVETIYNAVLLMLKNKYAFDVNVFKYVYYLHVRRRESVELLSNLGYLIDRSNLAYLFHLYFLTNIKAILGLVSEISSDCLRSRSTRSPLKDSGNNSSSRSTRSPLKDSGSSSNGTSDGGLDEFEREIAETEVFEEEFGIVKKVKLETYLALFETKGDLGVEHRNESRENDIIELFKLYMIDMPAVTGSGREDNIEVFSNYYCKHYEPMSFLELFNRYADKFSDKSKFYELLNALLRKKLKGGRDQEKVLLYLLDKYCYVNYYQHLLGSIRLVVEGVDVVNALDGVAGLIEELTRRYDALKPDFHSIGTGDNASHDSVVTTTSASRDSSVITTNASHGDVNRGASAIRGSDGMTNERKRTGQDGNTTDMLMVLLITTGLLNIKVQQSGVPSESEQMKELSQSVTRTIENLLQLIPFNADATLISEAKQTLLSLFSLTKISTSYATDQLNLYYSYALRESRYTSIFLVLLSVADGVNRATCPVKSPSRGSGRDAYRYHFVNKLVGVNSSINSHAYEQHLESMIATMSNATTSTRDHSESTRGLSGGDKGSAVADAASVVLLESIVVEYGNELSNLYELLHVMSNNVVYINSLKRVISALVKVDDGGSGEEEGDRGRWERLALVNFNAFYTIVVNNLTPNSSGAAGGSPKHGAKISKNALLYYNLYLLNFLITNFAHMLLDNNLLRVLDVVNEYAININSRLKSLSVRIINSFVGLLGQASVFYEHRKSLVSALTVPNDQNLVSLVDRVSGSCEQGPAVHSLSTTNAAGAGVSSAETLKMDITLLNYLIAKCIKISKLKLKLVLISTHLLRETRSLETLSYYAHNVLYLLLHLIYDPIQDVYSSILELMRLFSLQYSFVTGSSTDGGHATGDNATNGDRNGSNAASGNGTGDTRTSAITTCYTRTAPGTTTKLTSDRASGWSRAGSEGVTDGGGRSADDFEGNDLIYVLFGKLKHELIHGERFASLSTQGVGGGKQGGVVSQQPVETSEQLLVCNLISNLLMHLHDDYKFHIVNGFYRHIYDFAHASSSYSSSSSGLTNVTGNSVEVGADARQWMKELAAYISMFVYLPYSCHDLVNANINSILAMLIRLFSHGEFNSTLAHVFTSLVLINNGHIFPPSTSTGATIGTAKHGSPEVTKAAGGALDRQKDRVNRLIVYYLLYSLYPFSTVAIGANGAVSGTSTGDGGESVYGRSYSGLTDSVDGVNSYESSINGDCSPENAPASCSGSSSEGRAELKLTLLKLVYLFINPQFVLSCDYPLNHFFQASTAATNAATREMDARQKLIWSYIYLNKFDPNDAVNVNITRFIKLHNIQYILNTIVRVLIAVIFDNLFYNSVENKLIANRCLKFMLDRYPSYSGSVLDRLLSPPVADSCQVVGPDGAVDDDKVGNDNDYVEMGGIISRDVDAGTTKVANRDMDCAGVSNGGMEGFDGTPGDDYSIFYIMNYVERSPPSSELVSTGGPGRESAEGVEGRRNSQKKTTLFTTSRAVYIPHTSWQTKAKKDSVGMSTDSILVGSCLGIHTYYTTTSDLSKLKHQDQAAEQQDQLADPRRKLDEVVSFLTRCLRYHKCCKYALESLSLISNHYSNVLVATIIPSFLSVFECTETEEGEGADSAEVVYSREDDAVRSVYYLVSYNNDYFEYIFEQLVGTYHSNLEADSEDAGAGNHKNDMILELLLKLCNINGGELILDNKEEFFQLLSILNGLHCSTASTAATANINASSGSHSNNNASGGNHTNNNSGSGSHSNFNANSGSFSSKGQSASFSGNSDLLDRFLHSIDNDNIYKLIYLLIKEILEVVESSCNGLTGEESPVELYFVMLHKLMDNKMIVTNFMQEYLTFILHLTTMISGSSGSGGGRVGSGGGKGMEMVETYVYMLFNKLVSINTNKLGTVIDTIHDHLTTNYSVGDADRSRGGEEGSGGSSKNVWTSIIELCIGYLNNNSSSSLIKNPVEVLLILSERNVHNFVGGCLKLFGILIRLINATSGGGGASGPASMSGVQVNTSNQGATNRSRENRLNLLKLLSNLLNLNIRHYHQITSQLMLTIVKTTFESNLSRVSTESIMKLLTQAPSRTSNTLSQLFLNSKREVEDKRVVTANVLGLLTNVLDHEDLRKELLLIEKELLLSYLLSANNELTVPIAAKLAKLSEGRNLECVFAVVTASDTTLKHSLFNTLLDLLDSKLNVLNEPDIRILLQFLDSELVFNNKFNHFISQLSDSNTIANQSFYAQIVLYAVSNTRITDKLTFDLLFSLVQRVRVSSERLAAHWRDQSIFLMTRRRKYLSSWLRLIQAPRRPRSRWSALIATRSSMSGY